MATLLISQVAARAKVSAPTIRYYEEIGLLPRPARSSVGYRRYAESTVEELRFIRKAQALGFSLDEIRDILQLTRAGKAPCSRVLSLAQQHLAAVEDRIRHLQRFRDHLAAELTKWNGTQAPTCHGLCELIAAADAGTDVAVPDLRLTARGTRRGVRHGVSER